MKVFGALFGAALIGGFVFLLIPIMAVLSGISAWVVGVFFGDTIALTFMELFQTSVDLREIGYFNLGLTLGFFGGFIKSTTSYNSK